MGNISAFAEVLYIISTFEKGRVKSSNIWGRKYVESLKKSLEIMSLLVDLISKNAENSQEKMRCLQEFIHENNNIFPGEGNIEAFFTEPKDFVFSYNNVGVVTTLMNDIILETQNLLCTKERKYKIKISDLLRGFHNLPRVFFDPSVTTVFNLGIQPLTQQEAIQYAFSYLSSKDKITE